MSYWFGTFERTQRLWIVLAAVVLLPVWFLPTLPVWRMSMHAPQYPEGLTLVIYPNTIKGDVDKINTLNHYVGMAMIEPRDFREFRFMPAALSIFGVFALLAGLTGRRWFAALGWLAFTAFAVVMFADFGTWLWKYGHDLKPTAAIKLPTFTPPLFGYKRMANFRVWSLPDVGTFLLGIAWLLGPIVVWFDRRSARVPSRAA